MAPEPTPKYEIRPIGVEFRGGDGVLIGKLVHYFRL
jgi:hypothetical protein